MSDDLRENSELRSANANLTEDLDRHTRTLAAIAACCEEADTVRLAIATLLTTTSGVGQLVTALNE